MTEVSQTPSSPRLISGAPNLAEFAHDMAQLGRFTARELAIQYLDQNLAEGQDFDQAVEGFIPWCRYYV